MIKFVLFTVWLVVFMFVSTKSLELISAGNTIENLIGIIIMVVFILVTKILSNLKIKKNKNEED